ncbi:unnamed protein product [Spirodela intermedia]|uniref:Uncharacterized protein n=1 Tax=Spirodela intermedia TaxID=51605 RepID=A0A7I8J148_SPIIN|nr:unnamed protein product [Spirodela intermedia]CAA6663945.1 unnamed protein product [Spirodela intermedia]
MKQNEVEWLEYQKVMIDVIERSGLDEKIFYDLRGNHDNFGVPEFGGEYDFYQKYSVNARLGRRGNVHSVTLHKNGRKHLFVGFDSTTEVGLRGPTNLFGHPTDQLLKAVDSELSQWDSDFTESPVTKIAFGHFPLSFSSVSDSGRSLKDFFLKHSLAAYLCGHLHARFGENLKRHHYSDRHFLGNYYQLNICRDSLVSDADGQNCSMVYKPAEEFWEWEMESTKTIILPTFPVDSRFMQRSSSYRDYICHSLGTSSSYEMIRALVFSATRIRSVSLKIYDSNPGKLYLVLDSEMKKEYYNETRGDLYTAQWNWKAFTDPSPVRYWIQIEAVDVTGSSSFSELRPFSINGLTAKVDWKWKEFIFMGCQWVKLFLLDGLIWVLAELCRKKIIWSATLLYLLHLTFFPWFSGHIFTAPGHLGYMTHRGWDIRISKESIKKAYIGSPDVMVIVLPHLCFVILPSILLMATLAAEKSAYHVYCLSLSGKKLDDYDETGEHGDGTSTNRRRNIWERRIIRKFLLLLCLAILWRHWKSCRSLVKAYDMNPLVHSFTYCFTIPLLLAGAAYKTS